MKEIHATAKSDWLNLLEQQLDESLAKISSEPPSVEPPLSDPNAPAEASIMSLPPPLPMPVVLGEEIATPALAASGDGANSSSSKCEKEREIEG